ncbi:hypothetical protein [Castellaniella sp. MT123]|uniref:plasmid mobilization protein n=1 Tax=Castellaniella sp. MT123 TaxID=3140381 RepID=UPI0031F3F338
MEQKTIRKSQKPMPPSRKKEHTRKNISVRFSDSEREKLEQAAKDTGLFLTQLIRVRALKEDETAVKRLENLGHIRRTAGLVKALYKAINDIEQREHVRTKLDEQLGTISAELKALISILEKK